MKPVQKPGASILIVDDNPKNLQVLGRLLQMEKYEIEFAINGEVALDWINNKQFDLILLDINMPGMSGFEVFTKIRSNPRLNNVPIIFLSADRDKDSIFKGFELGAQDYVTKPFDSRELLMRVKTHLLLKKSQKDLENLNLSLEEKVIERTCQLKEALIKAEASDKLKTAFMNNISHEIRTPLNGILGFAKLVVKPDVTDEKKKYYLDILENSSKRLLNTITHYMDISLLVTGNQKVKNQAFYPSGLLHNIKEKFQHQCVNKGLALTLELPSLTEMFQTISDPALIYKIVDHLMDNALKFTNKGEISCGYTLNEDKVEFFVKDTGIGISPEVQNQMFDHFTQGDTFDTRKYEGCGLGLSIAKGLVELLKGEIRCESEPGKGSTFYFTVPFERPASKPHDNIVSEEGNKAPGKQVILLAEDDDSSYLFLKELFSSGSIELIRAINGAEAVEICRNNSSITLVLMDLKMPVMNGFDATRHIKTFNKNLPVVAISAYAMSGDEEKAMEAGCSDYIPKPVDLMRMEEIFNKYLTN